MTHELAASLARTALVAAVALVVVLVLRVPARRWLGAAFAYRLWLLVPVALLAAFLPAPVRPLIPALQVAPSMLLPMTAIKAPAAAIESTAIDWPIVLLASWVVGTLFLFAIFVRQQRRYLRYLGRLSADVGGMLRAQVTEGCPALVGALHPRIVLPSDFESRYSERERELVLAHERTHLARGDAQINAVVALLRCLNWFNPLFHFAASRFRFDQEIACDAAVMSRFPEARRCYADAMLKAQRVGESRQELRLPAGCHWLQSHPLKERIAMLKFPKPSAPRRALAAATLLSLTLLAGYTSWAAQPGRAPASAGITANSIASSDMIESEFVMSIDDERVLDTTNMELNSKRPPNERWSVEMAPSKDGSVQMWDTSHMTLINRPGVPWNITAKKGGENWELEGIVQPRTDGTLGMDVAIKHNGQIASNPRVITENGAPAGVQIDNGPGRRLALLFTLRKVTSEELRARNGNASPAATPQAGTQVASSDEKHAAAAQPAPSIQLGEIQDVGPSENITYRKMNPPKYPADAVKAMMGARLILKVLVDANGNAKSIDAEKIDLMGEPKASADGSTPNKEAFKEIFFEAASNAVKSWKFNPGYRNGKPFEGYALVPMDFSISNCGKDDPHPECKKLAPTTASSKQNGHA